jgi:hypothetical protein
MKQTMDRFTLPGLLILGWQLFWLPALHSKVQQVWLDRKFLHDLKARLARLNRPG